MNNVVNNLKNQLYQTIQEIKSNDARIKILNYNIDFLNKSNDKLKIEKECLIKMIKVNDDNFNINLLNMNDNNIVKKDDILQKIEKAIDEVAKIKWQPKLLKNNVIIEHASDKYILVKNMESLDIFDKSMELVHSISQYLIERKTDCPDKWYRFNFRVFDNIVIILYHFEYAKVKKVLKYFDIYENEFIDINNSEYEKYKNDYDNFFNLKNHYFKNIELYKELFVSFEINKHCIIIKYSGHNKTSNIEHYEISVNHGLALPIVITNKHVVNIYFNCLIIQDENREYSNIYDFNSSLIN